MREALEPLRSEIHVFNRDVLVELLPPATDKRARADSIVDGSKTETLLALLYVLSEYNASPADSFG